MSGSLHLMYYCKDCEHGYRVPRSDPDRGLLTLLMPCPNKNCEAGVVEFCDPQTVKHGETYPARLLYEACMGHGFPEERLCSPAHLEDLLMGATITGMALTPAGANRSIVESFVVRKGIDHHRVHFAMSVKGATIYKTEEVPHG